MHIDISACGEAPCWVYSNENVSGQLFKYHFVSVCTNCPYALGHAATVFAFFMSDHSVFYNTRRIITNQEVDIFITVKFHLVAFNCARY